MEYYNKIFEDRTILGIGHRLTEPEDKIANESKKKIKKKEEIYIEESARKSHFFCFGTTRVGKTRLMENMIEQDIRRGYNLVVIDPKGDIELFSKIVQVAFEEKRGKDLMLINPIFPEYSIKINPLSHYYMVEELANHIVSGIPIGKEPYFFNVAYEISTLIFQSLRYLKLKREKVAYFTLQDIKKNISHFDLKELYQELQQYEEIDDEAKILCRDLKKILDTGDEYYSKVSSSLRVAVMELTSGNIGKILGEANENKFITRLSEGRGVICVVQLGSLVARKASFTMGKLILSMIQSFIGRVFSAGKVLNPPLCIYIDEAQNVMYGNIDDMFAKAGGAGVWLNGFCQSVSQIYAELGKEKGSSILDNINSKLFMRLNDPDTAEIVARYFGSVKQYIPFVGLSEEADVNLRVSDEDLLKPHHFLQLPPREFYYISYHGIFKGKTIDVRPINLQVKYPEYLSVNIA